MLVYVHHTYACLTLSCNTMCGAYNPSTNICEKQKLMCQQAVHSPFMGALQVQVQMLPCKQQRSLKGRLRAASGLLHSLRCCHQLGLFGDLMMMTHCCHQLAISG